MSFFDIDNLIPLVVLICLLQYVGRQMEGDWIDPKWARGCAAIGFLLYVVFAWADLQPTDPWDFVTLLMQAVLAMGVAHGLARIVVPIVVFLHWHLVAEPRRRREEEAAQREQEIQAMNEKIAEAKRQEETRQRAEEERRRNTPPPPLTAQQKYEKAMELLKNPALSEMERKAGEEKAKQILLQEIQEVTQ